jgi:prepilin-type N-terminal cleavage/methylation domain-containing protein
MRTITLSGRGFTLIEMAMVLLIVALLLSGGMAVFSTQIEQQKFKDTQRILDDAREALIGFAAANDRLPCPAAPAATGTESPAGGVCTNPYNGFLPATTLGIPGVDANGYLLDGWGGRVRYAVTTVGASAATTTNGLTLATVPNLSVCGSATGITALTCVTAPVLTSTAVAIIFSLGANGSSGVAGGIDEAANQNADQVFVSHPPVAAGVAGTNGEFDDLFTWIPPAVLYNRLLQAGRLP